MKTVLLIDTSNNSKTIVSIKKNDRTYTLTSGKRETRAQVTLSLIEKLLKKTKMSIDEIDEIRVKRGPGSYTGLKVGVSIANALSFALLKPINDRKLGEIERPQY